VVLRVCTAPLALIVITIRILLWHFASHALQESTLQTLTLSACPVCLVNFPVHLVRLVCYVQQELFHLQVAHSAKHALRDLRRRRSVQAYAWGVLLASIL
jgi:hypothetical protein